MSPTTKFRLFGSDGLRGKASTEITPTLALQLGTAMGVLLRRGDHRHSVLIGKDPRISGYMLEPALTAGFTSVGTDVLLTGPLPTPAVAELVRSMRCDMGVMITGSHEGYETTGFKLFDSTGALLSEDMENKIEVLLGSDTTKCLVSPDKLGRAKRIEGAQERYVEYVKSLVPGLQLEGIRVVVDCSNGAAYQVAPQTLRELGAEVLVFNVKPDGFNVNHECGFLSPELLRARVREFRGDFGLALDGDADRVVVVGEYLNALLCKDLGKEKEFVSWKSDGLVLALKMLECMKQQGQSASKVLATFELVK